MDIYNIYGLKIKKSVAIWVLVVLAIAIVIIIAVVLNSKSKTEENKDLSYVKKQIVLNTFGTTFIMLLVSSIIVQNNSIILTTSPDSTKKPITLDKDSLSIYTSQISNYEKSQVEKITEIVIDNIKLNVSKIKINNYGVVLFEDINFKKNFGQLINSNYKIDNIIIKVGTSTIQENTIYFSSNEASNKNLILDFTINEKKDIHMKVNGDFIPMNITSVVVNQKIVLTVEYSKINNTNFAALFIVKNISIINE